MKEGRLMYIKYRNFKHKVRFLYGNWSWRSNPGPHKRKANNALQLNCSPSLGNCFNRTIFCILDLIIKLRLSWSFSFCFYLKDIYSTLHFQCCGNKGRDLSREKREKPFTCLCSTNLIWHTSAEGANDLKRCLTSNEVLSHGKVCFH